MTTEETQRITGGLDIGNGYVKAAMRDQRDDKADKFDVPAGVAMITGKPDLQIPDSAAAQAVEDAGSFFDTLDVSFQSSLIDSSYRHLFGTRGLQAESPLYEEFDVVRDISKADQQLSKVFILGLFAGKAVRDSVRFNGALPEGQLRVDAQVGLALPIDEYREHRVRYAADLKSQSHMVTVYNFETPVSVVITFDDVQVVAEGSSAQFAIRESGVKLTEAMLYDLERRGQVFDGIAAQDVYDAENIIGIDIGEGTVNFPVYTNRQFNGDVSRTFAEGYGRVLLNAMPELRKIGKPFSSRKKLADYLLSEPSPMKRQEYAKIKHVVDIQAELWVEALVREFGKVFDDVRYDAEVAYVYGGGSGPLRDILYPKLIERVEDSFPVLYLDASYSRHLNREGLLIAAEKVATLKSEQADSKGRRAKATAGAKA